MSPIFVAVVRVAACEICQNQSILKPGEYPQTCKFCGSEDWEWGSASADVRRIRQGITKLKRRLNPGAKSKKRQDRARSQHQAMQPKAVEPSGEVDAAAAAVGSRKAKKGLSRPNRGRA
jgi:hypothetical protein